MKTITSFLTASLFLVGCASTTPMALGPEHPASPDAPVAPLPPPSATLAVAATPTTAGGNTHDAPAHGGHGAGHAHHSATATTHPHTTEGATTKPQAQPLYACPMHAEVVSDKPSRCPECRMNLVKKKEAR